MLWNFGEFLGFLLEQIKHGAVEPLSRYTTTCWNEYIGMVEHHKGLCVTPTQKRIAKTSVGVQNKIGCYSFSRSQNDIINGGIQRRLF